MSFSESKWVWKNGEIIPWEEATTHLSVHALHYGSGVFEGIRCYDTPDGPAVFRLDAHLDRLLNSAMIHGMDIPFTREELVDAVCDVIQQNKFASCYVRPICYFGSGSLSLHPGKCPIEVAILAWPWAPYLGAEGLQKGVRVTVSPWVKFHSKMMPTTAKACGQYINSILAVRDAFKRGFDEALLLDTEGNIAEGSGENLFIVHGNEVITNDETDSILLGITRDAVIELARDLGHTVRTASISLNDLLAADEAFFTGTAAEVTPIREVDGTNIKDGLAGPVTREIQELFFKSTAGGNVKYRDWLHFVAPQPAGVR